MNISKYTVKIEWRDRDHYTNHYTKWYRSIVAYKLAGNGEMLEKGLYASVKTYGNTQFKLHNKWKAKVLVLNHELVRKKGLISDT